MKKTIITIAILLSGLTHAQELSINQGERTLIRTSLNDFQGKNGYLTAGIEIELKKDIKRYAVNAGYTFNNLFISNLEITPLVQYQGADASGIFGSLTVAYQIPDSRFKVQLINQYTNKYNAFLGIIFNFGKKD
jgi:hypothetical protein